MNRHPPRFVVEKGCDGNTLGGLLLAVILLKVFDGKVLHARHTEKLLLLLASAVLYFVAGEHVGIAGLLGVMAIGFVFSERRPISARRFSRQLAGVWVFGQIVLFALVGAEVNIGVAMQAGLIGAVIIGVGLVGRSVGVWIATAGTNLNAKERLFCMIAYTPKATVQAAIGALPLAAGVEAGGVILAIAVLSILLTAPLGAMGIKASAPVLLTRGSGPHVSQAPAPAACRE